MKLYSKIFRFVKQNFWYNYPEDHHIIFKMEHLILRWIRTRGTKWTIQRLKTIRNIVTRYMCGQPIRVSADKIGIDSSGFPKSVLFLKEQIDSGIRTRISIALTMLNVSRALVCRGDVKLETVTRPHSGHIKTIDPHFINKYVHDRGIELMVQPFGLDQLFFTQKAGIYGNQVWTSLISLRDWTGPMWRNAMILGSTSALLLKTIAGNYDSLRPEVISRFRAKMPEGSKATRKLSIVSDPEQKERVICIFDYFSQCLLEPLSKQQFFEQRRQEQDRTFTQDPIISNKRDKASKYYSYDLSAATDRMPIEIQRDQLSEFLKGHSSYAYAWMSTMTHQATVDHLGKPISYEVGQPMGARSSWAMFTHVHHLIVQYSAWLAGEYPTNQYILLGDDIVIYCDKVAEQYVAVMNNQGLEISPTKSHICENKYEFAKRWFVNGVEVTGLPINGFMTTMTNPIGMLSLLHDLVDRGFFLRVKAYEAVAEAQLIFTGSRARVAWIRNRLEVYDVLFRNFRSFNYDEIRNFIAKATKVNEYHIPASEVELRKEFLRVCNAVHAQNFMAQTAEWSRYFDKMKSTIQTKFYGPEVPNSVIHFDPTFNCIKNTIECLDEKKYIAQPDLKSQKDSIEELSLYDLDQVMSRKRALNVKRESVAAFGVKLYNQFRDYPEDEAGRNSYGQTALAVRVLKRSLKEFSKGQSDFCFRFTIQQN